MHLPASLQAQFKSAKSSHLPGKAPARWIHVATAGEFVYDGEPMTLTAETFDAFIKNFGEQKNPLPVYLNHDEQQAEGWVLDLKREGEELFANMEFGTDIADAIAKGKWRFCSMGFSLESVSRTTGDPIGPELMEVSLTNEPFLDGLQPVSLSRAPKGRVRMGMDVREIIQKHIKDGGSLADIESALASIKDGTEPEGDPRPPPAAAPLGAAPALSDAGNADKTLQDGEEALAAGGEAVALLMEATGLGPAEVLAAIRDNLEAIAAAIAGTSDTDGSPADLSRKWKDGDAKMSRENEALKIRLNAQQKQLDEIKAERDREAEAKLIAEVDQMVVDGKVLPGERDGALKLLRHNPREARAILGDRQIVPKRDEQKDEVLKFEDATYAKLSPANQRLVDSMHRKFGGRRSKDVLAQRVVQSLNNRRQQQEAR